MFASADKTSSPVTVARAKTTQPDGRRASQRPFFDPVSSFGQADGASFFGSQASDPFFAPRVQAKLEVSSPDDPQEKEADEVADAVMNMADAEVTTGAGAGEEEDDSLKRQVAQEEERDETPGEVEHSTVARSVRPAPVLDPLPLQRQEGAGGFASRGFGEEDTDGVEVQAKPLPHATPLWIPRSARGPPPPLTRSPPVPFETALASSKGQGFPLPLETRQSMEQRFGADFSRVRVHTGRHAAQLSASIRAQAFTHGGDIYFGEGKYAPQAESGRRLLAHELTHTVQQGKSPAIGNSVAAKLGEAGEITRRIQRVEAGTQREAAVELAKAEQGKVIANDTGPDGKRVGWERLLEYFKTSFGEDMILPEGAGTQEGTVNESQIKHYSTFVGLIPEADGIKTTKGERDVLPSWCGIFAFWALNKAGIPLPKWSLGESMIPPEAAYPPSHTPKAGDIAYRRERSHFGLVVSSDGSSVESMNGNTAGDDNLGGEVQLQTHPIAHWFGFFNPTMMMEGSLRSPEDSPGAEPVRSLEELRQELFNVNRKPEGSVAPSRGSGISGAPAAESSTDDGAPEELALEEQVEDKEELSAPGVATVLKPSAASSRVATKVFPQGPDDGGGSSRAVPVPLADTTAPALLPGAVDRQPAEPRIRGPPTRAPPTIVSLTSEEAVQPSLWDDAWDAVSGIANAAAEWVEQGLDAAKGWLLGQVRDFVSAVPGYDLLSLLLGHDPITGRATPMTGANLLEAGLGVLPLGRMFRELMTRLGIYNDVATWLEGRITDISTVASSVEERFVGFWNGLSLDDVAEPERVMNDVAGLLRSTIESIVGFVERAAVDFLEMIKEVMVREIAAFVRARIPNLYPLLTVALGFDPETMETVARNGTNILNALLEVSEEGREQRRQMLETGTFQRIVDWVDRGIEVFTTAYTLLTAAIAGIWDFVTVENLFSPDQTFTQIWNQFSAPVTLVTQFLIDAAIEILRVIKDALMSRLSAYAQETRGYSLITVIIGRDPFTDEQVPRTVHNLVKGFMGLMEGGEQQYEQLKESGAIDRIIDKVMAAVERLNMTPQSILQLFIDLWNSFSIRDLIQPIQAFMRIVRTFGEPILRLIRFVIEILMIVIEAILILMDFPFDLIGNIIAKAREAFELIKRDPAGFFKNLLRAIKQGFIQFFDNIGTHLLNGVVGWLMGELEDAGVPVLTDFSLGGVISWILEVLGISMEKIWEKLAEHPRIGPQRVAQIRSAIDTLEGIWTFIKDVQERGMAAIWDKIQEQLTNLWDTVLDAVKSWIMERIIASVVTRLLSMLDPTGIMAVVNSAIAIYRAVQSFIRYLTEMLRVVNSFVEGVVEVASGDISRAANALEGAMGRAMPVVIGFLANQVGLGGVGRRIGEMVGRAREMVDEAIGWLVNKAVNTAMALLDRVMAMVGSARDAVMGWLGLRTTFRSSDGRSHSIYISGSGSSARLIVESAPTAIDNLLQQASAKLAATPNPTLQPHYTAAVGLNREMNDLKARLAADNYASAQAKQTDHDALNAKMVAMSEKLTELMPLVDGPAPPDAVLPAFASGVRGGGFEALYLSSTTSGGQPASVNDGSTMPGWRELTTHTDPADPSKSIRERDNYVKMHLLHDQLGGRAADSNLAPTKSVYNTRFYNDCEQYAVQDKPTKVMWFKVTIDFHAAAGPVTGIDYSPYPSAFTGEYGHMDYTNGQWTKAPSQKRHASSSIPVPDLAGGGREYDINSAGATTIATMSHNGVEMPASYARIIALERTEAHDTGRHRKYRSFPDMQGRLSAREETRAASGYATGQQVLSALNSDQRLLFR